MKTYMTKISAIMLAVFLTVTTFALPARVDQPHMKAALNELRQAQKSLDKATPDKGGHRAKAIELTANAIAAVKNGIEWDRTHPGSTGSDEDVTTSAEPDQPNMVAARNSLNAALDELNKATPNKGGFREQAIGLVQNAIAEVTAGIEYANTH